MNTAMEESRGYRKERKRVREKRSDSLFLVSSLPIKPLLAFPEGSLLSNSFFFPPVPLFDLANVHIGPGCQGEVALVYFLRQLC